MQNPHALESRPAPSAVSQLNLLLATVFAIAFITAEALSILAGIIPSILAHAILIPLTLALYAFDRTNPYRRLLPVIALLSLLRLLSVTVPIKQVLPLYWHGIVSIPLLISAVLVARRLNLTPNALGIKNPFSPDRRTAQALPQIAIALTGIPLGLVGYWLYKPALVVPSSAWMLALAAALVIFAACVEEFIARGIAQRAAVEAFGQIGILLAALLFTVLYLGTLSPPYIFFVLLASIFWGWCREHSRGLWGVMGAHSLTGILMLIILPLILR